MVWIIVTGIVLLWIPVLRAGTSRNRSDGDELIHPTWDARRAR